MQELKSYYEVFIQNLEAGKEGDAETTEVVTEETTEDITVAYREFFAMYMEQIFIKIQSGDTEPTYQIGSQSFTEKEWETFLEKFDSIEEAIQELIKEEQARKEAIYEQALDRLSVAPDDIAYKKSIAELESIIDYKDAKEQIERIKTLLDAWYVTQEKERIYREEQAEKAEDKKELLIPAIKDCILKVDIKENTMTVHLLEGLR